MPTTHPIIKLEFIPAGCGGNKVGRHTVGAAGSILVIDDDRSVRDSVQFLLELEGYHVRAVTAAVAMALMSCQMPDLVLLDLEMPVLDGMEVRSYLLADPATARIPVVAMATADQLEEKQEALHAQGALVKPLIYSELLAEVARHLPFH